MLAARRMEQGNGKRDNSDHRMCFSQTALEMIGYLLKKDDIYEEYEYKKIR